MDKQPDPDEVAQELSTVQPMEPNLLDPWFLAGLKTGEIGAITATSHEPKTHLKTIVLDTETINDLMCSIISYIESIDTKNNKTFYEPQRQRLIVLLRTLDKLNIEK